MNIENKLVKFKISVFIFVLVAGYGIVGAAVNEATGRERLPMDFGWKFSLGHLWYMDEDFGYGGGNPVSNSKAGAAVGAVKEDFDDSDWEDVDVPHDWAVGLEFVKKSSGPGSTRTSKKMGKKTT